MKRLSAQVGDRGEKHPGVGTEETSAAELIEKIQEAAKQEEAGRHFDTEAGNLARAADDLKEEMDQKRTRIERLQRELESDHEDLQRLTAEGKEAARKALELKEQADALDLDALREKMAGIEEHNRKARENADHAKRVEELNGAVRVQEKLNDDLEALREKKAEAIAAADFPVDGLAIDEDGVTFQGVPLAQASGAEKIRISAAIGLAMNPELRVLLVRDASLLDDQSMAALTTFAAEKDAQIWLETVGDRPGACVVIEDGRARE